MKRREFITLFGGAAAAPMLMPRVVRAQRAKMPVIAVLNIGPPTSAVYRAGFPKGLAEAGYEDGRNVVIDEHIAPYDRLLSLVPELVSREVAVIFAAGSAGVAQAAKVATTTIPIVFANGSDPVAIGLVPRFNRPGGNVTGVSFSGSALGPKRLELLRELIPDASMIAVLVNPTNLVSESDVRAIQAAAASLGVRILVVGANSEQEIDAAFANISQRRADALMIDTDAFLNSRRAQITSLAVRYRIPASYPSAAYVTAGGLVSYSDNRTDTYRQAGIYVGRILKGDKPADLPVLQPSKFELVVNLKAAKAIGLAVAESFLLRADEVIE